MNDRLQISSAVPADLAEVMSDRPLRFDQGALDDAADALEAENRRMAKQEASRYLGQVEFWKEQLLDSNCEYLAEPLATLFANFTEACGGNEFAVNRLLGAFVYAVKCALPQAEEALFDIYQRGE